MVRIAKTFDFDAAHFLPMVATDHKCRRLHGHTYRCEIICAGEVRPDGMLLDYADISRAWWPIHELVDHRLLNDVAGLTNPTSELFAAWLAERLRSAIPSLNIIRLYESASTWAEVAL